MFTPITNGFGFVYPKHDFSDYDLSSKKAQNILLAKAADNEIKGEKQNAVLIYSKLENNSEAKAHLSRIETDVDCARPQQLLNLATLAEEHGSVNTAFHAYSELRLQSQDDNVRVTANQRLNHEKFKGYVIAAR